MVDGRTDVMQVLFLKEIEILLSARIVRTSEKTVSTTLSALLLAWATTSNSGGWMGWIALVPWLGAVHRSTWKGSAALSILFGAVFGASVVWWIPEAMGVFHSSPLIAWGALALAVGTNALPRFLAMGFVARWGAHRTPLTAVLGLACGAAVVDFLQGSVPGFIPWALLGHTQAANLGVAQLSAIGGVPLVSTLVGAVNAAITRAVVNRGSGEARTMLLTLAGCVAALSVAGEAVARWAYSSRVEGDSTRIVSIQPRFPADERWAVGSQRTNLLSVANLTSEALATGSGADLIVWPETTLTVAPGEDAALDADLNRWLERWNRPLLVGVARGAERPDSYVNTALWVEPDLTIRDEVEKRIGVPLVETAENRFWSPNRPSGDRHVHLSLERQLLEHTNPPLIVAFCYEVAFAREVAARRPQGAAAIVNLANDDWFVGDEVSQQQLRYSRFRAIEQRMWLLRVAHGGISAAVDPFGQVRRELPHGTTGFIVTDVRRYRESIVAELLVASVAIMGAFSGTALAFLFRLGRTAP